MNTNDEESWRWWDDLAKAPRAPRERWLQLRDPRRGVILALAATLGICGIAFAATFEFTGAGIMLLLLAGLAEAWRRL